MKRQYLLLLAGCFFFMAAHAQVQFPKIDSTLKIGKTGYRVDCRNKSYTQNPLSIKPIGFESGARDLNFTLKGRVSGAQIDDLNRDGYPDLVLFIYSDSNAISGTIYCFMSDANKEITPCVLPDASMNSKISAGYKGHDQFTLMEGTLLQKFPVYGTGENKDKPTGGNRTVLYQITKGESGGYKFTLIRSYDTK